MSTATLPRLIIADSHIPTYVMHSDAADIDLWRYTPTLPDGPFHWAQPGTITTPTIELTVGGVAELLLVSGVNPEGDVEQLVTAVDRALSLCHCDLTLAAAVAGAYLDEHWECARGWMDRCTLAAGRLLGIEV